MEAQVASVEPGDGVWLRGCVFHHHLRFLDGVSGGQSLFGADFVERNKHGGVYGAIDADKGAGDALHACDAAFLKFRCGCVIGRVLHFVTIRRCKPFVGRVLMARGYGVLEALHGFSEGVGHRDVNVLLRVVPTNGKSAVLAARWVDGDGVIIPECIEEVGGVVGGK